MNGSAQVSQSLANQSPLRIPPLIWISIILIQGIVYCIEPLWSTLIIAVTAFSFIFFISAITNTRWTLILILLATLLFPVRLFSYSPTEFIVIDPTSLSILILFFLSWTAAALKGRSPVSSTLLDRWFIALFILIILNCAISKYTDATVSMWQYFILTGPVLFLMVHHSFKDGNQISGAYALIISIITITSIYMIVEFIIGYNPIYHQLYLERGAHYNPEAQYYRATGFCGHPVTSGIAFSLVVPFAFFGLLYAASLPKRLLWGFISMLLILGAITTSARGTLLTILLGIILMIFRSLKTIVYTLTILIAILIIALSTGLMNFILVKLNPSYLAQDPSLWHRLLMHWSAWHIFMDYPIFGAGLMSMIKLYPQYKHPLDILNFVVVDNQFLSFLYGTGIVGMLIILGLFTKILTLTLNHRKHGQLTMMRHFRWAGFVSILAFYINSLNFDSISWAYSQTLFWFISALLMRLTTLPNDQIAHFFKLYGYNENSPEFAGIKKPPEP